MRVIDSIHEDGAKLVEIPPDAMLAVRASQPGLRIVRVCYYEPARVRRMKIALSVGSAAGVGVGVGAGSWSLTVVDRLTEKPIAGAQIAAFTDFVARAGAQGATDAQGRCTLVFDAKPKAVERLYVYPHRGYWSALRESVSTVAAYSVDLQPLALTDGDGLQHYYDPAADDDGKGVRIGIVDTGIALGHPDLAIEGGANTVVGETPQDFGDNGEEGHGTHVAGFAPGAARGQMECGVSLPERSAHSRRTPWNRATSGSRLG